MKQRKPVRYDEKNRREHVYDGHIDVCDKKSSKRRKGKIASGSSEQTQDRIVPFCLHPCSEWASNTFETARGLQFEGLGLGPILGDLD
jgi:hypothetical protein